MQLAHGIHLGYCTNIHRGENWEQTFATLRNYTLRVKQRVCPDKPYGIGLRLGNQASIELLAPGKIEEFKAWLEANDCYVFTINGFPYGSFHGTRVKEQVFLPDWSSKDRLEYTKRLFDILARLLPPGASGSVSTLPGSHKTFNSSADELNAMFENVRLIREHIETVSTATGHDLHLGFEPEPIGLFETSGEVLKFFGLYYDRHPQDKDFFKLIGLNYDTCHLAIEFETPKRALSRISGAGIRISKLHFSSALKLKPTPAMVVKLRAFEEPVYFHQVIADYGPTSPLRRFNDLPDAIQFAQNQPDQVGEEWRVHFHIPLHAEPTDGFESTRDHIEGAMDWLAQNPTKCQHIEMETYTWEVLPAEMRSGDVVDQLVKEYDWTLEAMRKVNLA